MPVGIIANNGVLLSESALKAAHFIELCAQRGTALVFLQNITGFMVGREYEAGGIAKDGAKMVTAVACAARVPKLHRGDRRQLQRRRQLRHVRARLWWPVYCFTWPNARVSVMGGEQAASVLVEVKRTQLAKGGKELSQAEAEKVRAPILEKYEHEGGPYYSTARLWDDGVIDPVDTRDALGLGLAVAYGRPSQATKFGVFRM